MSAIHAQPLVIDGCTGVIRTATETDAAAVVLETSTGAIRFYESLGFTEEGRLNSRRKRRYLPRHALLGCLPFLGGCRQTYGTGKSLADSDEELLYAAGGAT